MGETSGKATSSDSNAHLSIRELTRKISDLESTLSTYKSQKQSLSDEVAQLKFQLTVLRDQILDTEEIIKRTNQLEKEKSKQLSLFKRDHEALKHKCSVLEQQIEYRDEKLKELGVFVNLSGNFEMRQSTDDNTTTDTNSTSAESSSSPNTCNHITKNDVTSPSKDEIVSRLQSEIKSLKLDLQIEKTKNQNLINEQRQRELGGGDAATNSNSCASNEHPPHQSQTTSNVSSSGSLQNKLRELEFKNKQLEKDKEFLQNNLTIAEKARDREMLKSKTLEQEEDKLKLEVKTVRKDLKKLQVDYSDLESINNSLRRQVEKQSKKTGSGLKF